MNSRVGFVGALLALTLMSTSCASARLAPGTAQFPRELHGVWEGGVTSCRAPGNRDSDQRIEIAGSELSGYEDSQLPLHIAQVSTAPLAWKIRSRLQMYEESVDLDQIFLISGEDGGQLTIVNKSNSTRYERCN